MGISLCEEGVFVQRRTVVSISASLCVLVVLCSSLVIAHVFNKGDARASSTADNLIAWSTFNGDAQRSGVNSAETAITPSNVGSLTQLWQQTLPAVGDGAVA